MNNAKRIAAVCFLVCVIIAALLWAWNQEGGQPPEISVLENESEKEQEREMADMEMAGREELVFSADPGYFEKPFALEIEGRGTDADSEIRYTTDGSEPGKESDLYAEPISVTETVVIRARMIRGDGSMGDVRTGVYFAGERHSLPVVSITAEPDDLWSPEAGILRPENGAKGGVRDDTRIAAHIQWYEPDGTLGYEAGAGVRVMGGESREKPQKSLALYAKKQYGPKRFEYPFFPEAANHRYSSLVLRNGGQDFGQTHMRDAISGLLFQDTEVDAQYYRPVVVYINGEYYGICDLRDKISDKFLEQRHGVKASKLDLLESSGTVKEGSGEAFDALMERVERIRLGRSVDFSFAERDIDLDNFFDYMIGELYIANEDWPDHNIRYWKPQKEDGKWRWIFYDGDMSFLNAEYPATAKVMSDKMSKYPSIRLFQVLMSQPALREQFLRRFAFRLEGAFSAQRVLSAIEETKEALAPEMPRHAKRWGDSVDRWEAAVAEMETFVQRRPLLLMEELRQVFGMTAEEWGQFGFAEMERKLREGSQLIDEPVYYGRNDAEGRESNARQTKAEA